MSSRARKLRSSAGARDRFDRSVRLEEVAGRDDDDHAPLRDRGHTLVHARTGGRLLPGWLRACSSCADHRSRLGRSTAAALAGLDHRARSWSWRVSSLRARRWIAVVALDPGFAALARAADIDQRTTDQLGRWWPDSVVRRHARRTVGTTLKASAARGGMCIRTRDVEVH